MKLTTQLRGESKIAATRNWRFSGLMNLSTSKSPMFHILKVSRNLKANHNKN